MSVLVFNAGSATLKVALFEASPLRCTLRGQVGEFGDAAKLVVRGPGAPQSSRSIVAKDHAAAAAALLSALHDRLVSSGGALVVGHRLVHGGARFHAPLPLDPDRLEELSSLFGLAPLHLPPAVAVIREAAATLGADVRQIGVFDTAFFHDLPPPARDYALPRDWVERYDLRRYGFHGLAHQSMYAQFCELTGADPANVRVVSFQLGHGCSAAAIRGGRAVDTSMGFTPLDGLVMGTRPGSVDPGLILHLLGQGLAADDIAEGLQRRSGLLGLSGVSGDMRTLLELETRGHAGARAAIDSYCHAARRFLGAYFAVLGGADAVLFGGGIGEHAASIRARICAGMDWAGLRLDAQANAAIAGTGCISAAGSAVACHVLSVDEETVIARECRRVLTNPDPVTPPPPHTEVARPCKPCST